ncbi:MAG: hypothetical protein SFY80_05210 [Verrucomicrobiota bacterium]|nr:hypothetical protein [Verrucomicrobiota bacterium]
MHIDRDSLSKIFDWSSTLLIAIIAIWLMYALAGSPEAGKPMLVASVLTGLLWLCHGCWWYVDQDRPRKIRWAGLLPLPLVIYVMVRAGFSPAPWRGVLEAYPWLIIFSIWWVLIHGVRTRTRVWCVAGAIAVGLLLTFIFGMVQFYHQPNWLPLERDTLAVYIGQASGSFGLPDGLAALGLLLFPSLLLIASLPRIPGVGRFISAALAVLATMGMIFSLQLPAWYIWLGGLAPLPFLLAADRRHRIRYFVRIILLLIAGGLFLKLHGDRLWKALETGWNLPQQTERVVANETGWKLVLDAPVFGHGPGSLPEMWETVRPANATFTPSHLPSGWADYLYAYGIAGGSLLMLPVGLLLFRMVMKWHEEPWVHLSREQKERIEALDAFHDAEKAVRERRIASGKPVESDSQRKRKYKRKAIHKAGGTMPLIKILFPGLILGILSASIYAGVGGFWQFPVLSLYVFLILGFALKFYGWRELEISRRHRIGGVGFIVALALGGGVFVYGYYLFAPQYHYNESHERLIYTFANPQIIRSDPGYVEQSVGNMDATTKLLPAHGDALANYITFLLWQAQHSPTAPDIDPKALAGHLEMLATLAPQAPRTLLLTAWASAYLDQPAPEVLKAFDAAAAAAPNNADFQAIGVQAQQRLRTTSSTKDFFFSMDWPSLQPDPFTISGRARDKERYLWHKQ